MVNGLLKLKDDIGFFEEEPRHKIDKSFIREKEGYSEEAYIPKDNKGTILGQSGVTIGSGVDLGQRTEQELMDLKVNPQTIEKVRTYIGKRGKDAETTLKSFPLKLDSKEVDDLQSKVHDSNWNQYIDYYEETTNKKFTDLDPKLQTAVGSVVTQYGPDLQTRTPKFNKAIIDNDIPAIKNELENFGDKYPTRRKSEASLLDDLISMVNIFDVPNAEAARFKLKDDVGFFEGRGETFDPEGEGYDYEGARSAGITPDETGHWASRDPRSGLILKGAGHKTFDKTLKGEESEGYEVTKGEDGRYYSQKKKQKYKLKDDEGFFQREIPLLKKIGDAILRTSVGVGVSTGTQPTIKTERAAKSFATGVVGTVEQTAGFLQAYGGVEAKFAGTLIREQAKKAREALAIPDPTFIDQVAAGFGSMSTFLIPGMGVAKGVNMVSYMPRLAAWLGVGASSVLESTVESGGAYLRAKEKGMDEEKAKGAGAKAFWLNLPITIVTNKLGFFGDKGSAFLKGLKSAPLEAIQEFTQQIIGNAVVNDPLMQGALESAGVGFIVGGGTGGVVGGMEQLTAAKELKDKIGVETKEPLVKDIAVEEIKGEPLEEGALGEKVEVEGEIVPVVKKTTEAEEAIAEEIAPEKPVESKEEVFLKQYEKQLKDASEDVIKYSKNLRDEGFRVEIDKGADEIGISILKDGELIENRENLPESGKLLLVAEEAIVEAKERINFLNAKVEAEKAPEKPVTEKPVPEAEIAEKVPQKEISQGEVGLVEGVEPEKVRGISKSVKKEAIEEGLAEDLGDLPTYQKRDMADVAERASNFINTDYALAKKIALREAPEQGDLRAEELFTAIRIKAVVEEDIDTIRELATSEKAAKAGTEAGQRIKALDSSNENDPVKVIKAVTKERKEVSKGMSKEKKDAQITKLQNKLSELEEKVKTIESDLSENKTKRKASNKKPFGSKNKVFTQEGLEEARAALKGKLFGLHSGVDPTAVADLTKIGGFYFEGGVRNFSEWSKTMSQEFGDKVRPYLRKVWGNIQKQYNESKIKGIKEKLSKAELENANYLVQQLAESLVASGTIKRGNLVGSVRSILEEYYPDITARETADLISGYGKYKLLNKDKVKQILRDLKGQLQQVSKLEDLKRNQVPAKTGIERRIPSEEEKRLIKLVNEAKVKYGIKARQETSLKALKTRLENETKRLESKLEEMDFDEIQKREITLDAQASQLKEQRDRAKNAYNAAKYLKEDVTKEEVTIIVRLSKKASDAKAKLVKTNDWTADNAQQVEDYFYSKNDFENYVESLMPVKSKDIVNNFVDYFRASILASPRILRNSFLYQVIPGIERTITKRLVTGVFNDSDINSGIIEKLHAKLSGLKLNKKDVDFVKRQVAMATRIYHKTGYDISRMEKMGVPPKYFGEHVGKIRGDSPFAKYAKIVNLAPKWMAGGTDMLFANIGRADTAILMSKERAHLEGVKGILPEGVSEQERANQLLKDSYSFSPSENASNQIREAGIRDAHMMNNTQPGWWSDKVIEFRRMLSIGGINFGKALIPFAKIANVVVAEGVKTASGYGIAKSLYDINQSAKETDLNKRANALSVSVNNLVRYAGLTGAALVFTAFLDDDDFVGEWSVISKKEYILARAKGAGANYVKIGGKWIALRYLPMINIPISAIMTARQAKARDEDVATAYVSGIVGAIMSAPGVKESQVLLQRIGWSLKANNMEKIAKSMKMDWESMTNWAKVRMIPSVLSYDVWNALFPKDSKYDFMGREIQKAKVFKDDATNDIILEYERLAKTGNFPVISDPDGKYAKELEEKLGEEEYQKVLNKYKQDYASEIGLLIKTNHYKLADNENKKKKIDKKRKSEIMSATKSALFKIQREAINAL